MEINVNGTTIWYEKTGAGDPLILLHGNGESHGIFSEAIPLLAERFTVYAPDTRGHGKSAPAGVFHYTDMAEDTAAFIGALALEKPAVYGFSDGGITALLLALRYPDLPSRIAVGGANLRPGGLTRAFLKDSRRGYRKTQDPLTKLMLTEPHISLRDLKKIRVPVLVTAGEHDLVRERHTLRIARALPCGTLKIFAGETHESYIVNSTKFVPALISFLS